MTNIQSTKAICWAPRQCIIKYQLSFYCPKYRAGHANQKKNAVKDNRFFSIHNQISVMSYVDIARSGHSCIHFRHFAGEPKKKPKQSKANKKKNTKKTQEHCNI